LGFGLLDGLSRRTQGAGLKAAAGPARVFIVEHIVPEPDVPYFSKPFDERSYTRWVHLSPDPLACSGEPQTGGGPFD